MRSSFTLLKTAFDTVLERPERILAIMAVPAVLTFVSAFFENFEEGGTPEYFFSVALFISALAATIAMTLALVFSIAEPSLTVKAAYTKAAQTFVRYFLYTVLLSLIIIVGFILLVVPGIYLSVALSLSAYFLLLENRGIMDSFKASRESIKGRWWQVALRLLVLLLVSVLLVLVIEFISGMIGAFAGNDFGYALSTMLGLIATPIGIAFMYELYKDLTGTTNA